MCSSSMGPPLKTSPRRIGHTCKYGRFRPALRDPAGQLRGLPNPTRHQFLVELVLLVQSGFKPDQKQNFGGARYGWKMMGGKLVDLLARIR